MAAGRLCRAHRRQVATVGEGGCEPGVLASGCHQAVVHQIFAYRQLEARLDCS